MFFHLYFIVLQDLYNLDNFRNWEMEHKQVWEHTQLTLGKGGPQFLEAKEDRLLR